MNYAPGNPAPPLTPHGGPVIDYSRGGPMHASPYGIPSAVSIVNYAQGQPPKTLLVLHLPSSVPVTRYQWPGSQTTLTGAPPNAGGVSPNQVPHVGFPLGGPGNHLSSSAGPTRT